MTGWILAVLALFVVQTLLAPTIRYYGGRGGPGEKLDRALGTRDNPPPMPVHGERAHRALKNLFEALPVFLTLAIMIHIEGRATAAANIGAAIFLATRVLYVPLYVFGIYGLRSLVWSASWIGLILMIYALLA